MCLLRILFSSFFFFFNNTATTEIYTLSLHDALPIRASRGAGRKLEDTLAVASRGDARRSTPVPRGARQLESHQLSTPRGWNWIANDRRTAIGQRDRAPRARRARARPDRLRRNPCRREAD